MINEILILVVSYIFGLILNVLINILPKKQNINTYIKSIGFNTLISKQYIFVATLTSMLTYMIFIRLGASFEFLYMTILSYLFIVLSFIDLKYKGVPDYLLIISFFLSFYTSSLPFSKAIINACTLAGGIILLNFIITFYIQNIKARITNNHKLKKQQALGEADIIIFAIFGIILGIESGLFAVVLASIIAIIPSLYFTISKRSISIPFIPYLITGFYIEYFFHIRILLGIEFY